MDPRVKPAGDGREGHDRQVEERVPGAAQHEVVRCRHRSRVYPRSALKCAQVGQARLAWTVRVRGDPGSAVPWRVEDARKRAYRSTSFRAAPHPGHDYREQITRG